MANPDLETTVSEPTVAEEVKSGKDIPLAMEAAAKFAESGAVTDREDLMARVDALFAARYDVEATDCLIIAGLYNEIAGHIVADADPDSATTSAGNARQIIKYVMQTALYAEPKQRAQLLETAIALTRDWAAPADSVRVAMLLGPAATAKAVNAIVDAAVPADMVQTAAILALHGAPAPAPGSAGADAAEEGTDEDDGIESLRAAVTRLAAATPVAEEFVAGRHTHKLFKLLAAQLELTVPLKAADVYKDKVGNVKITPSVASESLVVNADAWASALVHAGHGADATLTANHGRWVGGRSTEAARRDAAAAVGFLHMFDWEGGLNAIDAFAQSDDAGVRTGSLLATGVALSGADDGAESAFHLLTNAIDENAAPKASLDAAYAALGLGIARAGRHDARAAAWLRGMLDTAFTVSKPERSLRALTLVCYAALGLGLVDAGSCSAADAMAICAGISTFDPLWAASQPVMRLGLAGLAALASCAGAEKAEPLSELTSGLLPHPEMVEYTEILISGLARAGSSTAADARETAETLQSAVADAFLEAETEAAGEDLDAGEIAAADIDESEDEVIEEKEEGAAGTAGVSGEDALKEMEAALRKRAERRKEKRARSKAKKTASGEERPAREFINPPGGAGGPPGGAGGFLAALGGAGGGAGGLNARLRSALATQGGGFGMAATSGHNDSEEAKNSSEACPALDPRPALVLQLALRALGDPVAEPMARRLCERVTQFSCAVASRAAPLALGLLTLGRPELSVSDALVRIAHTGDQTTSLNAILGLGLLGAGSRHTRLETALRGLLAQFSFSGHRVMAARLSCGLMELGKGAAAIRLTHSDRVIRPAALAAVVAFCSAISADWDLIRTQDHPLFAVLAPAITPRAAIAVDTAGANTDVEVRVGMPVETVGQLGRPRGVTGFQLQSTPVILPPSDRAEPVEHDVVATETIEDIIVVRSE